MPALTGWSRRTGLIVAVIIGTLGLLYYYRGYLLGGFSFVQSDTGDGRLTALQAAHWADVGRFTGGWLDLGMFFPTPDTMSYSDTMLSFGVFMIPLMAVGLPIFHAFQWTLILCSTVSFASGIAFLRLGPGVPWPLAITAGGVFTFGNGLYVASSHPQMLLLQLAPLLCLAGLGALRADTRWARFIWGAVAGFGLGIMTVTAFYVGWFIGLGFLLVVPLWILIEACGGRFRLALRRAGWLGGSALAGFSLTIPLTIAVYLPSIRSGFRTDPTQAYDHAILVRELVNVSTDNLMWGWLLTTERFSGIRDGVIMGYSAMAPTLVLISLTGVLCALALVRIRRIGSWAALGLAAGLAGFITWVLPIRQPGILVWQYVMWIPGAKDIRFIGRVELMASSLMVLSAVLLGWHFLQRRNLRPLGQAVIGLLCIGLLVEQVNLFPQQRMSLERIARLDATVPPLATCTSFVLVSKLPGFDETFAASMDAAYLSWKWHIPTWNGYSGHSPVGWNLFQPGEPDYPRNAASWANQNDLTDFCALDLANNYWLTPKQAKAFLSNG